eukprot:tig00020539_g10437.t1
MPLVRPTPAIRAALGEHEAGPSGVADEDGIELRRVVAAAASSRSKGAARGPWLHELLSGSEVVLPRDLDPACFPKKEKNPELEKRLEKLRAYAENQEYARMVSGLTVEQRREAERESMSSYFDQAGIGINILVSLITAFVVGHFLGRQWFDGDVAKSVIVGLVFAIVGLMIETWLFLFRASHMDRLVDRRERKEQQQGGHFPDMYRPLSWESKPWEASGMPTMY